MNNSRNSHYKLSDLFRHRVKWSDLSKSEKFSLIFGTCLRLIVFLASLAFVICLWSFVRESRVSSDYAYAEWVDSTNGTYDGSWSTSQSYYLSPDSDQFVPLVGGFSSSFGSVASDFKDWLLSSWQYPLYSGSGVTSPDNTSWQINLGILFPTRGIPDTGTLQWRYIFIESLNYNLAGTVYWRCYFDPAGANIGAYGLNPGNWYFYCPRSATDNNWNNFTTNKLVSTLTSGVLYDFYSPQASYVILPWSVPSTPSLKLLQLMGSSMFTSFPTYNEAKFVYPSSADAYQSGYNAGYSLGESSGYNSGYSAGFSDGSSNDGVSLNWLINSAGNLLNIKLGTGSNALTFGDLLFTMVSISIFGGLLKLFFGG